MRDISWLVVKMHQNLEFRFSVKTYGDSDVAILRNMSKNKIEGTPILKLATVKRL